MRARIQMLVTVDYEIVPANYPKDVRAYPEKMLALDVANAGDDVGLFIDSRNARIKIRSKLLNETQGPKQKSRSAKR